MEIAHVFPISHFAHAMQVSVLGTAFDWMDVIIVAACFPGRRLIRYLRDREVRQLRPSASR
jgi:hypothetical protein